jgi:hypothetical protein
MAVHGHARRTEAPGLEFVGIEQRPDAGSRAAFRDELGNPVKLGDYFGKGRPSSSTWATTNAQCFAVKCYKA